MRSSPPGSRTTDRGHDWFGHDWLSCVPGKQGPCHLRKKPPEAASTGLVRPFGAKRYREAIYLSTCPTRQTWLLFFSRVDYPTKAVPEKYPSRSVNRRAGESESRGCSSPTLRLFDSPAHHLAVRILISLEWPKTIRVPSGSIYYEARVPYRDIQFHNHCFSPPPETRT